VVICGARLEVFVLPGEYALSLVPFLEWSLQHVALVLVSPTGHEYTYRTYPRRQSSPGYRL
jgi:hypothetical protein